MKKITKFIAASLFLTALSVTVGSFKDKEPAITKADGEWQVTNTKALATQCYVYKDGTDAYLFSSLTNNDYNGLASDHMVVYNTTNYNVNDYNFLTHIKISFDNETYVSFSEIYNSSDNRHYFFKDGTFRFSLKHSNTATEEENLKVGEYIYIKVLEGCEFPSYDYCANGGTKKKFVQTSTTISKGVLDLHSSYLITNYSEYFEKPLVDFKQINVWGWNNKEYGPDTNYRQLLLDFDTDYLANNHLADVTNRATNGYDIGKYLTINEIPIYKIREYYDKTKVGYDHGENYLYILYPIDILLMNKNDMVPTLHINNKTEFMDVNLGEVTLKFVGDRWIANDSSDFKVDDPIDLGDYLFKDVTDVTLDVTLPHKIGTTGHPIFNPMPASGAKIAFTLNTGNIDLTSGSNAFNLDSIYNCKIEIQPNIGSIKLIDKDKENALVQEFKGFAFCANSDFTFEFEIVCLDSSTTFKAAINHLLVLNYTFDIKKAPTYIYAIDSSDEFVIDVYKELKQYNSSINNGGSSIYDFIEGDPVYNFEGVIDAFNIYDENVGFADLQFIYENGAVTDNKYNAGNWILTIRLDVDGYEVIDKTISINVHGSDSLVKVYYDDEPIDAYVGSKLTPPSTPSTYTQDDMDYIFDGWYLGNYKWDFENDVVESSMHLTSKFIATPHRYVVTVNYEGIDRNSETYRLTKNSSLPFVLFELDGAEYEVYLGEDKITSLLVTEDVTITVKYTVIYSHMEAKEATCTEDGNVEYWYSPIYPGYYFADSEGQELIEDAIIHHTGHQIIHLEAKDSTCTEVGNVDCYYCEKCEKHFKDPEGLEELEDWSIPKKQHVLTHYERVEPTCEQDGNVEYWTCANEPGVYYGDEEATIVLDSVVIPATGHDYQNPTYTWRPNGDNYECTATLTCSHCGHHYSETKTATKTMIKESTCTEEGKISYSVEFDDERFSKQTKIVNTPKEEHTYVFVERVEPTPEKDGVKEHYECSECHKYFIKQGNEYIEVQYGELIIKYVAPVTPRKGCGGDVTTTSILLSILSGALITTLILRKKEEK